VTNGSLGACQNDTMLDDLDASGASSSLEIAAFRLAVFNTPRASTEAHHHARSAPVKRRVTPSTITIDDERG
jgi:hypothetical protein